MARVAPPTLPSSVFSALLRAVPAARFLAAASAALLNPALPPRPATSPPSAAAGPPAAPPITAPAPAISTDSKSIGPCWARLATNQSIIPPGFSTDMSVKARW